MPRYDQVYETIVTALISQHEASFDMVVQQLRLAGMSEQAIIERIWEDLQNEGPLFGRFLNGLGAAGQSSLLSAKRQGAVVGSAITDKRVQKKIKQLGLDIERAAVEADPGLASDIELARAPLVDLMWVAELRNTCHFCLPLHGIIMTAEEWFDNGNHPDTIHQVNGIPALCYCDLIETKVITDREKALGPLERVNVPVDKEKGERLNRRTVRKVASKSLTVSTQAVDQLTRFKAGRRALRKLGQSMADRGDE